WNERIGGRDRRTDLEADVPVSEIVVTKLERSGRAVGNFKNNVSAKAIAQFFQGEILNGKMPGQLAKLRIQPNQSPAIDHEIKVIGKIGDLVGRRQMLACDDSERNGVFPFAVEHEQGMAGGGLERTVFGDAGRVNDRDAGGAI